MCLLLIHYNQAKNYYKHLRIKVKLLDIINKNIFIKSYNPQTNCHKCLRMKIKILDIIKKKSKTGKCEFLHITACKRINI